MALSRTPPLSGNRAASSSAGRGFRRPAQGQLQCSAHGSHRIAFPTSSTHSHRVTGKQPPAVAKAAHSRLPSAPDVAALSAAAAALLSYRPAPFRTAAALIVSAPALKELAQVLPARLGAGESSKYLLFGWHKHGGLTGVSGLTDRLPGVVQLLNALLEQTHPDGSWTTLGLFFSAAAQPHVDRRNVKTSHNHVLPLALPPTEQYMWVQRPVNGPLDPLAWLGWQGLCRFSPSSCCGAACFC